MAYTLVPTELIVDGAVTSAKLDTNIAISGTLGVTGELTLATHMIMGDNDKIKIGTGGDLEIYHDGSNSYISNSTGNIYLADTNGSVHIQAKLNEESIVCAADGAVTLYHDNAPKLATSSSGVSVTGTLAATLSTAAQPNITSVGTLTGLTGGTGDLNWDSGTLFVDSSSNRVGIGVTPSETLHVASRSRIQNLYLGEIASNFDVIQATSSAGLYLTGGGSNGIYLDSSANVGIGTSSPAAYYSGAKQLVVAKASGEAGITIATASDTNGALYFADGTTSSEAYQGGIGYQHSTSKLFLVESGVATCFFGPTEYVFNESSFDRDFRVESNGNANMLFVDGGNNRVGVGINNPTRTFEVNSGTTNVVARLESTDSRAALEFKDTAGTAEIGNLGNHLSFLPAGIERMALDDEGGLVVSPTTGGHAVFNEGSVDADFRVESNNNTHMLFVDGGNNRVGINNGTPTKTLDVSGVPYISNSGFVFHTLDKEITSGTADFTFSELNGACSDNFAYLVIVSLYNPSISTTFEHAGYVGFRITPRGSGGTLTQISKTLASGISTFSVDTLNDGMRVTTDTSPTLHARVIVLGGGGVSVPSE